MADQTSLHKRALFLAVVVIAAALVVLLGHDAVRDAASLFPFADSPHPYFVPEQALLLYVEAPLVILSAFVLILSPGLFLSLASNSVEDPGQWLLYGFALSLIIISIAGILIPAAITGSAFVVVLIGCSLIAFFVLLIRIRSNKVIRWPAHAVPTVLVITLAMIGFIAALAPKIYWENFNGDGVEAFETARLLMKKPLPFWPAASPLASSEGILSMLFPYPASWFIRMFGEFEASARIPFFLYLIALYGGILALANLGRSKSRSIPEQFLIWMGIGVYGIVMSYSATYNPYTADIALPATQETLVIVSFLGFVFSFLKRQSIWMIFFLALALIAAPNGILLTGFWLVASLIFFQREYLRQITIGGIALLFWGAIAFLAPHIFPVLHLPLPGTEYSFHSLLTRSNLSFSFDWHRVLFLAVPGGILPAIALMAWPLQDRIARAVTLVTFAYFLFFLFQSQVALHHFAPAMILPLVTFWRIEIMNSAARKIVLASCFVCAFIAAWISLPKDFTLYTSARVIGKTIEDRMTGYQTSDPKRFADAMLLENLFPMAWDDRVPDRAYGCSPLVLYYYARRSGQTGSGVNYVLQPSADSAPAGMRLVASRNGAALYVRDRSVWTAQRAIRPPTPAGSEVYWIPRKQLFSRTDRAN